MHGYPFQDASDYAYFNYSNMPYRQPPLRMGRPQDLGPYAYGGGSLLPSGFRENPRNPLYFDSRMNVQLEDPQVEETLISQVDASITDDYEDVPLMPQDPDNIMLPPSRSPSVPRTYPRMNDGLGPLPSDNGRYGGYNMRRDPSGGYFSMHPSYPGAMDDSTHPFCSVSYNKQSVTVENEIPYPTTLPSIFLLEDQTLNRY